MRLQHYQYLITFKLCLLISAADTEAAEPSDTEPLETGISLVSQGLSALGLFNSRNKWKGSSTMNYPICLS